MTDQIPAYTPEQREWLCTACGEVKPSTEFAAHGGGEHWCQDCYAEGVSQAANTEGSAE